MRKINNLVVLFNCRIWAFYLITLLLHLSFVISLQIYSNRAFLKNLRLEGITDNGHKTMSLSQMSMLSEEAEQPTYVVAEEQGKVVLPCNVTRPINDTIDLILWFRGDAETALYSLDARKAPIQRAKHFPSDDLSSRAYIDITGRPTALVVESVKAADGGEYKCRIDFRKGRTQYRSVQLEVIVAPKEVIIMDEYGQRLRDPVGPYNEGAHLTVICEAEGGKPRPNIWWLKDNNLLDDSWTLTPQGIVRNELVITRLLRTDHKTVLTCQASNSNLTKPVTSSITLELNLRPLDVKITTLHRPILADRRIEVICESGGSRPAALVTWWKGSKRLPHTTEQISKNENFTISTVHFTPSIEDNGKILSCRADHAILPDSALEDSWILDVYYTPRLTVSLGASIHHDQVREGSNVSFECHVVANPPVSEVGWKYDHKTITNNMNNVIISGNSLFLTKVNRQNSGKYRCVAANAEGEGESDDINLKILFAPTCKADQRIIFGVAKREPIKVGCDVEADPPQVTFRWTFNNTYELIPVKNFVSAKTRSIATYAPRSKYGYGELYCWAKNKVGEQREPCVFSVIPAGPPQAVRNCLVGNQSTEGLVVKCEHGEDGGLEQNFHLEIYQSEDGQIQSNWSSPKAPLFEVSGLPIATSFVLVLYAANAKGRSNYVTLTASTLPFPSRGTEVGLKPVIYLLIAVIGSLVIAATVIMIISKVRAIDQKKGCRRNSFKRSQLNNKRSSEEVNAENARRCAHQNGNITGIQMATLYVKAFDVMDDSLNPINDSWDQQINQQKYEMIEENKIPNTAPESHLTLALEQRRTPEGDAFIERSASDSTSTMSSTHPQDFKRINRYLMPPTSIVGDQTIIMTDVRDDETISCETPLMNGIYYTSFTSNTHRPTQQKHVTPLSTPV